MASTDLVTVPTASGIVPQRFVVEPLGGPKDVFYYLDQFPEEIYRKTPDARLYKFMRALLGEQGVNWIKKNYLLARLLFEEMNIDLFDLDRFYGSPFQFGRILEESFDTDPTGLISREEWQEIQAKNARYRNRALDFVNGARAGNTPEGMCLVARSGLGHDVEVVENYKYWFDLHTDDPLGLPFLGKTDDVNEFVVIPRRELTQTITQHITIDAYPEDPDGGSFVLYYNGDSTIRYGYSYDGVTTLYDLPYNATSDHVRLALEAFPQIGEGNVSVTGDGPWHVTFVGALANRAVYDLKVDNLLTYSGGESDISISVTRTTSYSDEADRDASFSAADEYHLQQALDRIRPVTSTYTIATSRGAKVRNNWREVRASSEYSEVLRFVTGTPNILWPETDSTHWIEPEVESKAPRPLDDLQHHYQGFQNIYNVTASSTGVLVGSDESTTIPSAAYALADYVEPLFVTSTIELRDNTAASFVNGIYPIDYQDLPGTLPVNYKNDLYWQSADRSGQESLLIDLGEARAVNNISLELNAANIRVDVEYDLLDGPTSENLVAVTPDRVYNNSVADDGLSTWVPLGLSFTNSKGNVIFARYINLVFTRLRDYAGPIKVRNVRVARNVA